MSANPLIENKEMIVTYFDSLISDVFKILPLYEEKNIGLEANVNSLYENIKQLEFVIHFKHGYEYITILNSLKVIEEKVQEDNHSIVKREVFKCIHLIKNIISKLEEGE